MKNELNIISPTGDVTIREGSALPLKEPVPYLFSGNLKAVRAFFDKHYRKEGQRKEAISSDPTLIEVVEEANYVHADLAVFEVNKDDMQIVLKCNPQNVYGTVITGKLLKTTELKQFHINEEETFNRDSLLKLIRFNKAYFPNKDQHDRLVKAIQTFQIRSENDIKVDTDQRGNRDLGWKKKVVWDGPENFFLELPLFKGYEAKKFQVDICLDTSESKVILWLESVELAELINTELNTLINEELAGIPDEYVIMYK